MYQPLLIPWPSQINLFVQHRSKFGIKATGLKIYIQTTMHPTLKCKQHSWTHRDFIPWLAATMDWETQASGCWHITLTLTVSVVFDVRLILVAPFSMSGLWSRPIRVAEKKRIKVTWKVIGLLKNKIYVKLTSYWVKMDVHIYTEMGLTKCCTCTHREMCLTKCYTCK